MSTTRKEREFNPTGLFLMLIVGVVLAAYYYYTKEQKKKERQQTIGRPSIGGSFTLIDQWGRPVTDLDFRGRFMLLYFGFTNCPDICPTELEKMALVLNTLEQNGVVDMVVPMMVSVDPWRDTVAQLREYCPQFHNRLIGFTGTPEQVMNCAKKFRVYTSKPPTTADGEMEEDYLVDHSIMMYLVSPSGEFLEFYGQDKEEPFISKKILERCKDEYYKHNPSIWYGLTKLFS